MTSPTSSRNFTHDSESTHRFVLRELVANPARAHSPGIERTPSRNNFPAMRGTLFRCVDHLRKHRIVSPKAA
jgi:hypothetical protein